jgi:hypothetical protein
MSGRFFFCAQNREIFSEKFSSPRRCPTTLDTIAGEMITKILHIIETAMNRIHPQILCQPCFTKQEEFAFVKNQRSFLP